MNRNKIFSIDLSEPDFVHYKHVGKCTRIFQNGNRHGHPILAGKIRMVPKGEPYDRVRLTAGTLLKPIERKGEDGMEDNVILSYIEPIFRYCCRRISNRYDAEDLASEIICHILNGLGKYQIESLDAWVWRIAHNRYARYLQNRSKNQILFWDEEKIDEIPDYTELDEPAIEQQYETIFRYLHTLSSEYRNIFVDHYIGELSVKKLAEKYSLPETTVKWRMNVGRQRIKERMAQDKMDKIYQRINWNTTTCNGNMDSDAYLHSQISRAICLAAYEKPLTIEEISMRTGIPAMYIEDELPRLEYGDAICRAGKKYAANFIIFRLKDRNQVEKISESAVKKITDQVEILLKSIESEIKSLPFYGHDFGICRLGYIIVPYLLRRKIEDVKNNRLCLNNGPYPPRRDGGYGWFIVEETPDEAENSAEYNAGCNTDAYENKNECEAAPYHIYYYWISKYFDYNIYHNKGIRWLCANGIPQKSVHGILPRELLTEEDAARLIEINLLAKSEENYRLSFPCFTGEQFRDFAALFENSDEKTDKLLEAWISAVRKNFEDIVPIRLHGQINQWISIYLHQLIGYVTDELIRREVLRKPSPEKPLTDGVFLVEGSYINP